MASLYREHGRHVIQWLDHERNRKTLRLGRISQRGAEEVRLRIEYLVAAHISNTPVDAPTLRWLEGVGVQLREKLAAKGLCEAHGSATFGAWAREYADSRTDLSARGHAVLDQAIKRLAATFEGRDLRGVTPADADSWLVAAKTKYADATVSRDVTFAKHLWSVAVKRSLATANPFEHLKAPRKDNPERQAWISADVAQRVLEACPDWRWRLVFSLARWGGLRVPSELARLKWADVMWDLKRIRVHGKTGPRVMPLFPELLEPLNAAWDNAKEGAAKVLPWVEEDSELRKDLQRIVSRAGLDIWPRIFHNLRSSRQTELEDQGYPSHVVSRWMGNTPQVARKHYLQLTDEHFERAARGGAALHQAVDAPGFRVSPARAGAAENPGDCEPPGSR